MNNPRYAWNRKRLAVFLFIILAAIAAAGISFVTLGLAAEFWHDLNTSIGRNP